MKHIVDLFMFMGQSNMAGRGITSEQWPQRAPELIKGAGYEFRAISDGSMLYPIREPFGVNENNPEGITEQSKTGSLVTAFVNAYYIETGIPIVGVSAAKGGSKISEWQPGSPYMVDALQRMKAAVQFLDSHDYTIRHKFMLWCQGESDGDIGKSMDTYQLEFERMLNNMLEYGIETCYMIQIGNYNGTGTQDYTEIQKTQVKIARENKNVVLVSTEFAGMKERGLMKDDFHYYQTAYNEVGTNAGRRTAFDIIKNNK